MVLKTTKGFTFLLLRHDKRRIKIYLAVHNDYIFKVISMKTGK